MIIYSVFNSVAWVGGFFCAAFSTEDRAETFIINNLDKFPDLYIETMELDSKEFLE